VDNLILLRALWDRIAAAAFIAGGGLLVIDAGLHARDAVFVANSLSFLTSGGLGGLAALAVGCTLLVSAGFHDEWRKLDRIEAALPVARMAVQTTAGEAPPATGSGRRLRAESDRVAGWALAIGGAVWLAVGARLVSSALYAPDQVAYLISGGLAAMTTLVLGLAVLLIADTRDEERKLEKIRARLGVDIDGTAADTPSSSKGTVIPIALGFAAGGVLVLAGWWKAADALRVDRAMDGLVLAAAGVGVVGAVLTVGGLRRRRRLALRARLILTLLTRPDTALQAVVPHANGNGQRWTAEGLHHFHVAACPALAGIRPEQRTAARPGTDLEPCLLCDAALPADGVTVDA
jgi:hypothetical protein